MTQFLKTLSIKTKLTLVIMLASAVLLSIVGSVVLIAEIYSTRTVLTQELRILTNILSANSQQSLVLGEYSKIDALLGSLIHQKNIHAAYVFDRHGDAVAEYLTQQDSQFVLQSLRSDFKPTHKSFWTDSTSEHLLSSLNHFSLFAPVFYEGEVVGSLYLLSDLQRLYGHLSGVAFAVTLAFLLLISFSWLLAGWLQKPVSIPLIRLAGLMGKISEDKDYSVRAKKQSHDEVGILVDGFNQMLQQIELDQSRLAEHQIHLEHLVSERTAELRTAVAELERAREQAETANEAKSLFLSRMTHELRTPLIGVLGMNELMLRTPLTEQQQLLVDTIQKSGQQLLHLISDILDFSKIEAGKLSLVTNVFRIDQVVEDVVALLLPQAEEKGITVQVDTSLSSSCQVDADEPRIRQIVMNLLGNAIKFTLSGTISVKLDCPQKSASHGTFILTVADTGSGMSAAAMEKVFDAFYQADNLATSDGTGLGLAIVKQLVELMDGKLELISVPGRGSQFQMTVIIPLVGTEPPTKGCN